MGDVTTGTRLATAGAGDATTGANLTTAGTYIRSLRMYIWNHQTAIHNFYTYTPYFTRLPAIGYREPAHHFRIYFLTALSYSAPQSTPANDFSAPPSMLIRRFIVSLQKIGGTSDVSSSLAARALPYRHNIQNHQRKNNYYGFSTTHPTTLVGSPL